MLMGQGRIAIMHIMFDVRHQQGALMFLWVRSPTCKTGACMHVQMFTSCLIKGGEQDLSTVPVRQERSSCANVFEFGA